MRDERMDVSYERLSSGDRNHDGESDSIESQRRIISAHAREKYGIISLTEYIDDGFSGTNFERPGFRNLLTQIENRRVRTLFVKDLSRLGRNYLEVGYFLEYVFPKYGVRVIAVNDGFDSDDYRNTTIGLEVAIKNLFNAQYSRDISVKIKGTVDRKKKAGEYAFGAVAFGYKKSGKNRIAIDEPAACTVRHIFNLALQKNTVTMIAQQLNQEKVMTPSQYLAEIRPNYKIRTFWTYDSVANILKNRIYTGDTEIFKSHVKKVGSDNVKMIPLKEREVVENTHEAIIEREEFWEAQKAIRTIRKGKGETDIRPLAGKLVCGCCGNRLSIGKKSNKDYLCPNRRYDVKSACTQVRCRAGDMEDIVLRAIQIYVELAEQQRRNRIRKKAEQQERISGLEREIGKAAHMMEWTAKSKLDQYEEYVQGKITRTAFLEIKEKLNRQEQEWDNTKKELESRLKREKEKDSETEECSFGSVNQGMTEVLDKRMVQELIDRIVVYPDKRIEIEWNFMNMLAEDVNRYLRDKEWGNYENTG